MITKKEIGILNGLKYLLLILGITFISAITLLQNSCTPAIAEEVARDDKNIFYTEEIEVDSMKYLIISVVPLGQSRVSTSVVNLTKDSLECAYYELQLEPAP